MRDPVTVSIKPSTSSVLGLTDDQDLLLRTVLDSPKPGWPASDKLHEGKVRFDFDGCPSFSCGRTAAPSLVARRDLESAVRDQMLVPGCAMTRVYEGIYRN